MPTGHTIWSGRVASYGASTPSKRAWPGTDRAWRTAVGFVAVTACLVAGCAASGSTSTPASSTDTTQSNTAQSNTAQSSTAQSSTDTTQSSTAQSSTAQSNTAQSNTAQSGAAPVDGDPAASEPTGEGASSQTGDSPSAAATTGLIADPVRSEAASRSIYFVVPDRFANGSSANDTAGIDGGPLDHGYLPTEKGFHHGGDLVGLTEKLDYLDGLGVGAIWITPPFRNNYVQGDGTIDGSSSSYHGYWQIDWDTIDPHLGTEAEMQAFIEAAHDRDILVYFDVVVNHTGDIISYADGSYSYSSTTAAPYLDADGQPFDVAALAGSDAFPPLDAATSFPHVPVVTADKPTKSPAWLNDVTNYHNRGDTTFSGESNIYGDFFGLDDLFTENPAVVAGLIELYQDIIERYDVDGFRVDTVKHVNTEFWAAWTPAVHDAAADTGNDDFFVFGEVASPDPILGSSFTNLGLSGLLDFGIDAAITRYVADRGSAEDLAAAFDDDDWYTDTDNNASMQVTFFGNHDAGRMGYAIDTANPGASEDELLARMKLGFDLVFASRGAPVIYYGDEQGFVGTGGDQLARQDMFASQTPEYLAEFQIGTAATPGDDNFDPNHPLYRHVAGWNALRDEHPALRRGAQLTHEATGPVFALSRIDRDELVEYVVLTNTNASLPVPARVSTLSPDTTFSPLWPSPPEIDTVTADATGEVLVEVPPLASVVLRADQAVSAPDTEPSITIVRPKPDAIIPTNRYRIEAEVGDHRYAEVTFSLEVGSDEPVLLGVDDAAPYRLYWDTTDLDDGETATVVATVIDTAGHTATARLPVTLGERP